MLDIGLLDDDFLRLETQLADLCLGQWLAFSQLSDLSAHILLALSPNRTRTREGLVTGLDRSSSSCLWRMDLVQVKLVDAIFRQHIAIQTGPWHLSFLKDRRQLFLRPSVD